MKLTQVYLPVEVRAWMDRHAAVAYPAEACGILVGLRQGLVVEAIPTPNLMRRTCSQAAFSVPLASVLGIRKLLAAVRARRRQTPVTVPYCWWRHPLAYWRAWRGVRQAQALHVIGFYHTHPNAPAVPSGDDCRYAWPGHLYLIARVNRTMPAGALIRDVRPWRAWTDVETHHPTELPITICDANAPVVVASRK